MRRRPGIIWIVTVSLLGTGAAARAQSEYRPVSGVLEHYYWAYEEGNRVEAGQHARYLHLRTALHSAVRLAAGAITLAGKSHLDENYAEFGGDRLRWRVGRFRAAFGHSDWSECYYTGFVHGPLVRTTPFGQNLPLNRLDTGIDLLAGSGAFQYQIGVIDARARSYALLPARPDHLVTRLQFYQGSLILGWNMLVEPGRLGSGTRLFDVDWRWSAPQVQMRGEFATGRARGGHADGYYLDLFYHPIGLHRTTFLARTEAVTTRAGLSQLYTLGVKQIISPVLTLALTHGWGNSLATARGWAVQSITFLHF